VRLFGVIVARRDVVLDAFRLGRKAERHLAADIAYRAGFQAGELPRIDVAPRRSSHGGVDVRAS
jgi:hypothetical protein